QHSKGLRAHRVARQPRNRFEIAEKVDELFALRDPADPFDDHILGERNRDIQMSGTGVGLEMKLAARPGQSRKDDLLHLSPRLAVHDGPRHESSLHEDLVDALTSALLDLESLLQILFRDVTPSHEGRADAMVLSCRARRAQLSVLEEELADLLFSKNGQSSREAAPLDAPENDEQGGFGELAREDRVLRRRSGL